MQLVNDLVYGEKSLDFWLKIGSDSGSLIKAFTKNLIHIAYEHYPSEDYFSQSGRLQFFYHSHRDNGEHGHIHVYIRKDKHSDPIHYVAIGLSNKGLPISLFTVTSESVNEQLVELQFLLKTANDALMLVDGEDTLTMFVSSFCLFYGKQIKRLITQKYYHEANRLLNNDISSMIQIDWSSDLDKAEENK